MSDLNVIDAEFTEVTAEPFDYAALDTDTAKQLQEIAEQDMRATAVFWIARAERLAKAHELLANYHGGTFGKWVVREIRISDDTAMRLINAYEQYRLVSASCGNSSTAEALPQSFYRKLAANDPNAEQIKEEVLAGKIKDSKEYKAALERIKELERKNKAKDDEKDSAEKTIQNLKSVLADTRKQLSEASEKAKGADEKYLAQLKDEAAKAKAQARRANLDYEGLQDRFEDLNKRGGDLMRERDKYAQMAEEIAGELKQAQELNARLLAERKQSDTETDIAVLLATAIRQIDDENLELCVRRILRLNDGEKILRRFKEMADIACIKGD